MEKVEPTTIKDTYKLEDKDYLLIKALKELTIAIEMLRRSMK